MRSQNNIVAKNFRKLSQDLEKKGQPKSQQNSSNQNTTLFDQPNLNGNNMIEANQREKQEQEFPPTLYNNNHFLKKKLCLEIQHLNLRDP